MAAALQFEKVTKLYGRAAALHELSLAVAPGEIFGFLGANGAGKTTAIHIAMGLVRPTGGSGALLGVPFTKARKARARVGYVPDAPVFFAGSALDSVLFAARLNDAEGERATPGLRGRALEVLRLFDLPPEGKDACKFSRGMQQRLALAQATVLRPELLILDEPTSALDPAAVALVREALFRARNEGAAVFFSSHQLHEVEQLCDRAAFLRDGRVLHAGSMNELLREGAMARVTLRGLGREHPFLRAESASLEQAGHGARGDLVFAVPIDAQRAFLERAWAAGAELVRVERVGRTLEELFTERALGDGK